MRSATVVRSKRDMRLRRHRRVRGKITGTAERPRLAVFRSNRGIFAQLVDDATGRTLAGASWIGPQGLQGRQERAGARRSARRSPRRRRRPASRSVVFDRGGYLYHGRVKALADGAREGGLKF